MNPLAYHILERLEPRGPDVAVDQKGDFGRHVNRQPEFAHSRRMPDLVTDNIGDVVRHEFALSPPAVPDDQQPISKNDYQRFWQRELEREPWDIYTIAEDMAAEFNINRGWAFKNARQHLNQLVLQARMRGYRQERLAGRRFRWAGPDAEHPACEWIRDRVPDDGLPYHELVELMQEAKHGHVDDPPPTSHAVHDWCRHEVREVR